MTRLLIVTAVEAERDAAARLLRGRGSTALGMREVITAATSRGEVTVLAGGAGPAAAGAATATALALAPFDLVLSAGIAGGFGLPLGTVVTANRIIYADLGSETGEPLYSSEDYFEQQVPTFASAESLGYGRNVYAVDDTVCADLVRRTGALPGPLLTVSTVTGTAATAAARLARYPGALAEGMEGAGIAAAAVESAVNYGEIRTISNLVGPRDRSSWQIPQALHALAAAVLAFTS